MRRPKLDGFTSAIAARWRDEEVEDDEGAGGEGESWVRRAREGGDARLKKDQDRSEPVEVRSTVVGHSLARKRSLLSLVVVTGLLMMSKLVPRQ